MARALGIVGTAFVLVFALAPLSAEAQQIFASGRRRRDDN